MKHYLVLVHSRTKFELDISKLAQAAQFRKNLQKIQNFEKFETHTHTHTGCQLEITFLVALDCSEYSNTSISIFFYENTFLSEEAKMFAFTLKLAIINSILPKPYRV